jgi:hypothetical protein
MSDFPPLPDYFTLRLAADLSSAVRGQTVWFDYGDQGLQVTDPGPPGSTTPLPVLTPLLAKARPMVKHAKIRAEGYKHHTLPGDKFSALFWSESAVEKFLLPYYVSAGGQQALRVLHAINHAWYNYNVDTPVVALAFGYPSEPFTTDSVQLWDTLYVIYGDAEKKHLKRKSLREFLATQGPPPPPEHLDSASVSWGPVPTGTGATPTPIDSVAAREVAEYVSGWRGENVYVYENAVGAGLDTTLTQTGDGPPLFTAWTRKVRPDRPEATVELKVATEICGLPVIIEKKLSGIGGRAANVADSVFWTDGSIETLLVPYYASVEGGGAPWYLILILGKWSGMIPTGIVDAVLLLAQILEAFGRVLLGDSADATTSATATGPVTSDVFGLIHLPDSEWVDQTAPFVQSSIFLENRTWLLTTEGDHPLVSPRRRLVRRPLRG